ncbi:MAG: hypothetical protein PF505_04435 [Vallitaleaceae bacterium]|jgi:Na+/phosphate symporter|nr:hypothetical protein [Vallitaleaceae bacterium]
MKKKIAPIIIVIIMTSYLIVYAVALTFGMLSEVPAFVSLMLGIGAIIVLIAIIGLIYTLVERLKEIDKEDDDDLSKY